MPKAKVSDLQGLRIELQQTERDMLELVTTSSAVENVLNGVGSIIQPFLQMTPTSGLLLASLLAVPTVGSAIDKTASAVRAVTNPKSMEKYANIATGKRPSDSQVKSPQVKIATSPAMIRFVGEFKRGLESLGLD
jgi:hypothetical protein